MTYNEILTMVSNSACFRPLQGLPIMNGAEITYRKRYSLGCFRPLQGLPIMNPYLQNPDKHYLK